MEGKTITELTDNMYSIIEKDVVDFLKTKAGKISKIKGEIVIDPKYQELINAGFSTIMKAYPTARLKKLPFGPYSPPRPYLADISCFILPFVAIDKLGV